MSKLNNFSLSYKDLLIFSLPSILSSLFEPLASMVDTAFVGHLNTQWIAALAICSIIFGSLTWIFNFIVHTSTQSVASAYGQQSWKLLQDHIKVSLIVSVGVGIFALLFMMLFKDVLFSLAATSPEIYPFVDEYYSIRLMFHPFLIIFVTLIALLRGLGRVRLSFGIILITTLLNIFLTWLFLYPLQMSIGGAAWGTSIANVFGCLLALYFLFTMNPIRKGFFRGIPTRGHWFSFGKSSIHLFGRSLTLSSVFFLSTRFASSLGTDSLAAYQVSMQIWLFASFLTDGLAITANIYTSNFRGRGDFEKLLEVVKKLINLSIGIGILLVAIYWVGREEIWMLFTTDPKLLVAIAATWAFIAFSQLPNAVTYVLDGVLFGLEAFSFLRTNIMLGTLFLYLPLALMVVPQNEISYLWIGIILLNFYRGITSFYYIKYKVNRDRL